MMGKSCVRQLILVTNATPMSRHTNPFGLSTDRLKPPSAGYQVTRITNRLKAILLHIPYYSFEGSAKLARDTGLAPSSVSRIIRGKMSPSYVVVESIARAISHRWRKRLDPREIFTTNGSYPTPSTCELMGCLGCLPPEAWSETTDTLRSQWKQQRPGDWCHYQGDESRYRAEHASDQPFSTQIPVLNTQKPGGGPACKQVPSSPEVYL